MIEQGAFARLLAGSGGSLPANRLAARRRFLLLHRRSNQISIQLLDSLPLFSIRGRQKLPRQFASLAGGRCAMDHKHILEVLAA